VLDPDDHAAYDLVVAVAAGEIDDVAEIARVLAAFVSRPGFLLGRCRSRSCAELRPTTGVVRGPLR
jgi:hypothetical protein